MYEITVQTEFCAAHALIISGQREPVHGHNWKVAAVLAGTTLDPDGLLCDFHTAENVLKEIVSPFNNNNLNACEPFSTGTNPSAELVAKYIADELADRLDEALRPHARVASVSVTEAPGCVAKYVRVGRGQG
jgi:6-pyruvoyltetrahydropterin/6-carboxytetrahydropterin synthase